MHAERGEHWVTVCCNLHQLLHHWRVSSEEPPGPGLTGSDRFYPVSTNLGPVDLETNVEGVDWKG